MILSNLKNSARYIGLHPSFEKAFNYVKAHDFSQAELGKIEIEGEQLFINNSEVPGLTKESQIVEVHRKYIDIHILLEGEETIGWLPAHELKKEHTPYDEEKDYAFYSDTPSTYVTLRPGDFFIAFPEDGHAPIISEGKIHKLIVKALL